MEVDINSAASFHCVIPIYATIEKETFKNMFMLLNQIHIIWHTYSLNFWGLQCYQFTSSLSQIICISVM